MLEPSTKIWKFSLFSKLWLFKIFLNNLNFKTFNFQNTKEKPPKKTKKG